MQIFLLRHGYARARSSKRQPDRLRPLTHTGEKEMFKVARGIQSLESSFDVILTSPYVRALCTAEILAEVLGLKSVVSCAALLPEAKAQAIISEINKTFPKAKKIVLVSHEPYLSKLISRLISGQENSAIHFRKAGFGKLTVADLRLGNCARLEWLLTSHQLKRLAQ